MQKLFLLFLVAVCESRKECCQRRRTKYLNNKVPQFYFFYRFKWIPGFQTLPSLVSVFKKPPPLSGGSNCYPTSIWSGAIKVYASSLNQKLYIASSPGSVAGSMYIYNLDGSSPSCVLMPAQQDQSGYYVTNMVDFANVIPGADLSGVYTAITGTQTGAMPFLYFNSNNEEHYPGQDLQTAFPTLYATGTTLTITPAPAANNQ